MENVYIAPIKDHQRPKKGTLVELTDGRVVSIEGWAFGKANVRMKGGGAVFAVKTDQVWEKTEDPNPPQEKSVFEGQVDAILGIIGMSNDYASSKFPDFHCVRVSKRATHPGEPPQFEKYLGWGYKKLSEDPVDTGGADMILMGVPHEVWARLESALDQATNAWKQNFNDDDETFPRYYEESERKSLDDLSKGFSS